MLLVSWEICSADLQVLLLLWENRNQKKRENFLKAGERQSNRIRRWLLNIEGVLVGSMWLGLGGHQKGRLTSFYYLYYSRSPFKIKIPFCYLLFPTAGIFPCFLWISKSTYVPPLTCAFAEYLPSFLISLSKCGAFTGQKQFWPGKVDVQQLSSCTTYSYFCLWPCSFSGKSWNAPTSSWAQGEKGRGTATPSPLSLPA